MSQKKWYYIFEDSNTQQSFIKAVDGWPILSMSKIDPSSGNINHNYILDISMVLEALNRYYGLDESSIIDNETLWFRLKNIIDDDDIDFHIWVSNYNYGSKHVYDDMIKFTCENEDIYRYRNATLPTKWTESRKYLFMPLSFSNYYGGEIRTYQKDYSIFRDNIYNDVGIEENGGPLGAEATARPVKESYIIFNNLDDINRRIINCYSGRLYCDISAYPPYGDNLLCEYLGNLGVLGVGVVQENYDVYKICKNSQDANTGLVITPTFTNREWTDYGDVSPGRIYPIGNINNIDGELNISGETIGEGYTYPRMYNQEYKLRSKGTYEAYCEKTSTFGITSHPDENFGHFRHIQSIGSLPPEGDQGRYKAYIASGEDGTYRVHRSRMFASPDITNFVKIKDGDLVYDTHWYFEEDYFGFENELSRNNVFIHEPSYVTVSYDTISEVSDDAGILRPPVKAFKINKNTGTHIWSIDDDDDFESEESDAGAQNPREYYYVGDLPLKLEPGMYAFIAEGPQKYLNRLQYPTTPPTASPGVWDDYSGQLAKEQNKVAEFVINISPLQGIVPVYQKIIHTGESDIGGENSDYDDVIIAVNNLWRTDNTSINYSIAFNNTNNAYQTLLLSQYNTDGVVIYDNISNVFDQMSMSPNHVSDPHLYLLSSNKVLVVYKYKENISTANRVQRNYYGRYAQWSMPFGVNYPVDQVIAKVLTWDSTNSCWDWDKDTDSRFIIKSDIYTSATGSDPINNTNVVDLLDTQNKYRVTGISEMKNGNILIGIQHAEVRGEKLKNKVIRCDWYYGESDWKEDPDTAGNTAVMFGYVQVVGEASNIKEGDWLYIYVPPYRRDGDPGAPLQGVYTYPTPCRVSRLDYVEDSDSTFITLDPGPDRYSLETPIPPDLASKEQSLQYWKDADEHEIFEEGDEEKRLTEPYLYRVLPPTEYRSELLEIGKNEFNIIGSYLPVTIENTYVPTENKEFNLSTDWDEERQGYVAEVPTGMVVWEESPEFSIINENNLKVTGRLMKEENKWYVYTQEKVENATLTIEVYPEGPLQPIGKMESRDGENKYSYDAVYHNGKFYKYEDSELSNLYTDHTERVYQAKHLIADPVKNDFYTATNNEIYKYFLALVGDRPRNICTPRLPVLKPNASYSKEKAIEGLAEVNEFGYTVDYINNFSGFENMLRDNNIYTLSSFSDIQEIRRNTLSESFVVNWGEDAEYTTQNLASSTTKEINTNIVNKSDAMLRYIYEKIAKHSDYPILKIKTEMEDIEVDYINKGLGKLWQLRGIFRTTNRNVKKFPASGNPYLILAKYELNPKITEATLYFFYIPEEL